MERDLYKFSVTWIFLTFEKNYKIKLFKTLIANVIFTKFTFTLSMQNEIQLGMVFVNDMTNIY